MDIFGAPPQTLCDAAAGYGGTWNRDGVIVFAPTANGPLFRVSAAGGVATQLTELDRSRQETAHRHPSFLPDGRHFLYLAMSSKPEDSGIYVGSLDSKERKRLLGSTLKAMFAPPDRALFMRENTLMAQRFDLRRVAVFKQDGGAGDIWTLDLIRGTTSRFTFDPGTDNAPVWSPDGTRIVFQSNRGGVFDHYQKNSGGVGQEEVLLKSDHGKTPDDWSSDGRFILYRDQDPKTGSDLWVLPLTGDRKPQPVLQTPFSEIQGRFSPDGRWIAYVSDESGTDQVYVQSFPASGTKYQISTGGGYQPRWRRDGRELFFISGAREAMAVEVGTSKDGVFQAGVPQKLFQANPVLLTTPRNFWDVTPDGQRFLVNSSGTSTAIAPITVVVNWMLGGPTTKSP